MYTKGRSPCAILQVPVFDDVLLIQRPLAGHKQGEAKEKPKTLCQAASRVDIKLACSQYFGPKSRSFHWSEGDVPE